MESYGRDPTNLAQLKQDLAVNPKCTLSCEALGPLPVHVEIINISLSLKGGLYSIECKERVCNPETQQYCSSGEMKATSFVIKTASIYAILKPGWCIKAGNTFGKS